MVLGDLILLSSSFGIVFVSSDVILRIVLMMKLASFVYSTGSPGHGPIHLLIQSAEDIGFSGILSRLVGFGLVFLHCV